MCELLQDEAGQTSGQLEPHGSQEGTGEMSAGAIDLQRWAP